MKRAKTALAAALFLVAGGVFAQDATINDAQIAAIAKAANDVDIEGGTTAKEKATNPEVRAFGQKMVNDHSGVNKQAADLLKKLKVKPEENATSKELKATGADNLRRIRGQKGADFDRAYIDNEVTFHQTVLDALDKTLIPNAKNEQLKAFLEKIRPNIAAHLEHAKQLQAKLGK